MSSKSQLLASEALFPPLVENWTAIHDSEWVLRTLTCSKQSAPRWVDRVKETSESPVMVENRAEAEKLVKSQANRTVRSEYYKRRFGASASPLPVLVEIALNETGEDLTILSDEMEKYYWNELRGYTVLPEISNLLISHDTQGSPLMSECEMAHQRLRRARTLKEAYMRHAVARIRLLAHFAAGGLSVEAVWTGYLTIDYELIQLTLAKDLSLAARTAELKQATAVKVELRHGHTDLMNNRARHHILTAGSMWHTLQNTPFANADFLELGISWNEIKQASIKLGSAPFLLHAVSETTRSSGKP